jgi:hypothetical protein
MNKQVNQPHQDLASQVEAGIIDMDTLSTEEQTQIQHLLAAGKKLERSAPSRSSGSWLDNSFLGSNMSNRDTLVAVGVGLGTGMLTYGALIAVSALVKRFSTEDAVSGFGQGLLGSSGSLSEIGSGISLG